MSYTKKEKHKVAEKLIEYFSNNIELLKYIDIWDYDLGFDVVREIILYGKFPKLLPIRCLGLSGKSAVLSPDGYIYPCYIAAENRIIPIGRYYPKIQIYSKRIRELQSRNVYNLKKCKKCPLLLICAGGCPFKDITSKELEKIKHSTITIKEITNCMDQKLLENDISMLFFKFREFLKKEKKNTN